MTLDGDLVELIGEGNLVGGVLPAAGAGSADIVDAHAIAVAAEDDRAVVVTGDPGDLERLAAPHPGVTVVALS